MGYNISGMVIANNYDKSIEKLCADLNWELEVVEEVILEVVMERHTPEGEFRIYFGEKGTLIFFDQGYVFRQFRSPKFNTLGFAYFATSMAFQFDYFENDKLLRTITEYNGEKMMSQGEVLPEENVGNNDTTPGLIFTYMDKVFGEPFMDVDLGEMGFRCKKIPSNTF